MIPAELKESLQKHIASTDHSRELVVDVMFAVQDYYGYLNDEAVEEVAEVLGMSPVEVEQLATFYTFIYRDPVGKYVIHVCDSLVCWMEGHESLLDHLSGKLGISLGETTPDGMFSLLPVCCIATATGRRLF
jgi:NADH-quinone oxidoreductase subunit E